MQGQWKIKELHPLSIWGKLNQFVQFQMDRTIIQINEQVDFFDGGEYIAAEVVFSPVENDEMDILNTPFYIAGMILEEV